MHEVMDRVHAIMQACMAAGIPADKVTAMALVVTAKMLAEEIQQSARHATTLN